MGTEYSGAMGDTNFDHGVTRIVEDVNPPDTTALPPQSIQHPVQRSVTEATTGLLPQEVKRTNELK